MKGGVGILARASSLLVLLAAACQGSYVHAEVGHLAASQFSAFPMGLDVPAHQPSASRFLELRRD